MSTKSTRLMLAAALVAAPVLPPSAMAQVRFLGAEVRGGLAWAVGDLGDGLGKPETEPIVTGSGRQPRVDDVGGCLLDVPRARSVLRRMELGPVQVSGRALR